MAVVMSGTASTGAKWRIHDDCYKNNTPERNEMLRRAACEIAHESLVQYANEHGGANDAENRRNDRQGRRLRL